jgi:nitrite reductase/ring-hydroxylating ferredoxin subunit
MGGFAKAARCADLPAGSARTGSVNGREIALFNVGGKIYATTNTCPHAGGPLGEGDLEGTVVTCPWHGWQFDVTTGASPVNPKAKVPTYEIKIEGEDVLVKV